MVSQSPNHYEVQPHAVADMFCLYVDVMQSETPQFDWELKLLYESMVISS